MENKDVLTRYSAPYERGFQFSCLHNRNQLPLFSKHTTDEHGSLLFSHKALLHHRTRHHRSNDNLLASKLVTVFGDQLESEAKWIKTRDHRVEARRLLKVSSFDKVEGEIMENISFSVYFLSSLEDTTLVTLGIGPLGSDHSKAQLEHPRSPPDHDLPCRFSTNQLSHHFKQPDRR